MDGEQRDRSGTGVLSPLDAARASFLPGLAQEAMPVPCTDEELERIPVHTAERLLALEPERYALATALFFGCGLPHRMVCRVARLSPHTLTAIIRRESNSRTAEEWRQSMSGDLRALAAMAQSAAGELLADPEAVREGGLRGVATILRELTHAHELLAGRMPGQASSKAPSADDYLAAMREAHGQSIVGEEIQGSREARMVEDAGVIAGDEEGEPCAK